MKIPLFRRANRPHFAFAFTHKEIETMQRAIRQCLGPLMADLIRPRDRVLFYIALIAMAEELYQRSRIDCERSIAI